MTAMTSLSPFTWIGFGGVLLVLGLWQDWGLCRSLGVGGTVAGLALWGLGETGPLHQLAMFGGLSLIAWIGGRRMDRLADALPTSHFAGVGIVGRIGTVARAFRNGHGTVAVNGQVYAATAREDLPEGAEVRVTGLDDEALRVDRKG